MKTDYEIGTKLESFILRTAQHSLIPCVTFLTGYSENKLNYDVQVTFAMLL